MLTALFLILILAFIVVGITRWRIHPFLCLLIAALAMGFAGGLDVSAIMSTLTAGFGNTLKSIGIVIAFGTIIGTFLERNRGATSIAESLLKLVGEKRSPLVMSITGFIVSIPVFCDSGFVILSTLNRALSKRTKLSLAVLGVALATGLYATHVFVPPTPGPLAAAATLGADVGLVLMFGLVVSIPVVVVGLLWAVAYCRRFQITPEELPASNEEERANPSVWLALAPIIVPIVLIALKSIAEYPTAPLGNGLFRTWIVFVGNPVVALFAGVVLAMALGDKASHSQRFKWTAQGLERAGTIILITGAGGAFGNILRATDLGDVIGSTAVDLNIGILLPFIVAALLKTAQGSSTVAIITTAAILAPLLGPLGLESPQARALVVLAIGAGSMTVSHVNDSYFWVVAQFSNMDTATALRTHTLATLFQGVIGLATVFFLSLVLV